MVQALLEEVERFDEDTKPLASFAAGAGVAFIRDFGPPGGAFNRADQRS